MVTVELQTAPRLRLTARGHAGAAACGKDLVCAGISTLLCTLAAQLQQESHPAETVLESGYADLSASRTAQAAAAFSFAETGLRLLAQRYPNCLQIRKTQDESEKEPSFL